MSKKFHFLLFRSAAENVSVNALIKDETIWLTQKAMAQLFGCTTDNISLHLKNIFLEKELSEKSTTEEFSVVRKEGTRQVQRKTKFYNLDAIISVGYRVNSKRATQFQEKQPLQKHMRNTKDSTRPKKLFQILTA